MLCPNCSKEIRDTAKVCGYCGHKILITPSKCPECGEDVREGAKVCGYCGYKFTGTAKASAQEHALPKQEEEAEPVQPVELKISNRPEAPKQPAERVPEPRQESPPALQRKIFPGWAWGLIGVFVLASIAGIFLWNSNPGREKPATPTSDQVKTATSVPTARLTPTQKAETETPTNASQVVIFSKACGESAAAEADQPLEIHYGFWGVLKEYFQENYDFMDFQIYINGERYYGNRIKQPLALSSVPCVDQANWAVEWQQGSLWIYDVLELDSLPAGEYQVDVTYYLAASVNDGMTADTGELLVWGPGEFQTLTFQLRIEP